MSQNPCRTFFQLHELNQDKVKALNEQEDRLKWEGLSASDYSPGIVDSGEVLCRILFDPIHFDQFTSTLKPSAFDDICNKGLSVNRVKHRGIAESLAAGAAQAETASRSRTPRSLYGHLVALASELRSVAREGQRCLAIYDTAIPENPSHADVCMVVPDRAAFRSARAQLHDKYKSQLVPA